MRRVNWFDYYRTQHNIPELGCAEDNELLLVSKETLRLALHGLRFAIAESDNRNETPHVPSIMASHEINNLLLEHGPTVSVPTGHRWPTRLQKQEPNNGQHKLLGAADMRPLHEIKRVRKSYRRTRGKWKNYGLSIRAT